MPVTQGGLRLVSSQPEPASADMQWQYGKVSCGSWGGTKAALQAMPEQ